MKFIGQGSATFVKLLSQKLNQNFFGSFFFTNLNKSFQEVNFNQAFLFVIWIVRLCSSEFEKFFQRTVPSPFKI